MNGLPGFGGHLIAPSFLARTICPIDAATSTQWRAAAAVCWSARACLGPASSVRLIFDVAVTPLLTTLGFDPPDNVEVTDRFLTASVRMDRATVAIVTASWGEPLGGLWRVAIAESAHRGAMWCVVCNGLQLRIVDASRVYARRYVECDLPLVMDHVESFAGLVRVIGRHALFGDPASPRSLQSLARESEQDAARVCRSLREGVLSASGDVLAALLARGADLSPAAVADAFDQSLTIVYRLVFLLFAEARALVPVWHPTYRESYSVEALRDTAEQRDPLGIWDALRAMCRLAHAGCRAGDLQVTPFNGRLFAPARTPLAERRDLDDAAAKRAVLALSTRPTIDRAGRERITYRELGVEELGAVYETLLDYQPRVTSIPTVGRRRKTAVSLEPGSGTRKATGTFYTPQPVADYLVRRTLAPLVKDATPDAILSLRVVDPAMGSGAFLVAACRYLASAYEQALIAAGRCHASDLSNADRTTMRRLVAERCLYGVDLNPMAVQLARLSLWLATLAADRPLSFLDHRLMTGNSLLGTWLRQLSHAPIIAARRSQSRPLPLFADDLLTDAMSATLPVRFSLERTPNDTIEQVRDKERALASLTHYSSAHSRWRRVADLWCAIWFPASTGNVPSEAYRDLADAIISGSCALPAQTSSAYLAYAETIAAARRFFHWELEFPEVFFDGEGRRLANPGFDAVIGNPPWDMMRADAGDEHDTIGRTGERQDVAAAVRFTRNSGVYRATPHGHVNRYQLFVERAIALTRAEGRVGLVLPSGFAADQGSAALRRELLGRCDVDAIVGIDNVRAVFPIHRSVRFLLVTATAGRSSDRVCCRFGVESLSELEAIGETDTGSTAFPIVLTPSAIARLSGSPLTIPHLRSVVDLRIIERSTARFAPLGSREGWSARFGRELNATDDRAVLHSSGVGWPVFEGKHLEPFRIATTATSRTVAAADARRLLGSHRVERPRLAYRDVASATNRVTLIAAILPARSASTHTLFCLRDSFPMRDQYALCGLFNSLVVNYLVRLRVTTHVTTAIVEQLPVPSRRDAPAGIRDIARLARLLAKHHHRDAFATLNARVARLYQLTTEEFDHVLKTFPLIPIEDRIQALNMFRQGG
jgi:hypothetical protein